MKNMKQLFYKNKGLGRSVLSLALCLVLCAALFAAPAFADGSFVVIGGKVEESSTASEPSSAMVVSGSGNTGSVSSGNAASGIGAIEADAAAGSQVVVSKEHTEAAVQNDSGMGAIVVNPDGSRTVVGGSKAQSADTEAAAAGSQAAALPANTVPAGLHSEIYSLVNKTRSEKGVGSVSYSSALQAIADLRAKESASVFGHTRPDGSHCSTAVTVDYQVTGENLIQVTTEFASAAIMMDTWMNSASHAYNILLPAFTNMAVGTYVQGGTTYVSLIFVG